MHPYITFYKTRYPPFGCRENCKKHKRKTKISNLSFLYSSSPPSLTTVPTIAFPPETRIQTAQSPRNRQKKIPSAKGMADENSVWSDLFPDPAWTQFIGEWAESMALNAMVDRRLNNWYWNWISQILYA